MLKDYLYKKPTIDTERLQLRPLRPEDAEDMRLWTPEKGMYTYWGKSAGKADKHPEMLFAATEKPSKSLHLGIVRREDDRVIGEVWVYLIEKDRMAKLALRIGAPFQNAGFATEATNAIVAFCFTHTELMRLWTDADVRNVSSWRVLEKCGFTREGLIRQGKMVSTFCDYYIYGLLRTDPAAQERIASGSCVQK